MHGGDFTIRGGAADGSVGDKMGWAVKQSYMRRLPFVRLLDATGGSVRTFESDGPNLSLLQRPHGRSRIDADGAGRFDGAGLGRGIPAVQAAMCHFNVMVKGTTQVFVAGPAGREGGQGLEITKEELGNEDVQVASRASIANLAENEEDAFRQVREFLSYLPSSVWEMPARI